MIAPGESAEDAAVLWSGAPDPAKHFTAVDWFLIPFSLVWTAGVVTVLSKVSEAGFLGWTVGTLLMIAGGYVTIGRFFVKAAVKRRTRYVLEGDRAIIYGPRRTFVFDLAVKYLNVETQRSRRHATFVFTTVEPRTNGKFTLILIENSGLDAHLIPGRDTRFKLVDVRDDGSLQAALASAAFRGRVPPRSA